MRENLPKAYEPAEVEAKWYSCWERQGLFKPAEDGADAKRFSIVIPPPNVTGTLHIGHAFCFTLHDVIVRWKRMLGYAVLWLPGTDHAGIATQNVVEKSLREQENLGRKDLGRKAFEERVWKWKEEYGGRILDQLRRLGASCDWDRLRFTLDQGLSRAVREVFVRLYEEGLIYKGEYIVNWCPRCETAISDLETQYETLEGKLWYVRYPIKGRPGEYITVATTRPETMLGDTAVAMNPDDERFAHLKGATLVLPLLGREIPLIQDSMVAMDFGTGMVKVTPSHDPNDFQTGQRHNLPFIRVINEHGRMTDEAGPFAGLDRYECREKVLQQLEAEGLLEKVEKHVHNVGHCQRCTTVVEPLVSSQWFVRIKPLADQAVASVQDGLVTFLPNRYEKTFFTWMADIHDWCISRQLWWGHRIPAWKCGACGQYTVTRTDPDKCAHCGSTAIQQEEDVLDTWFSSALWPFSTLGWPDATPDLRRFYPTDLLITGYDIIFFWVARMIMMGMKCMEAPPFRTVYIHGLVRDEHNHKMSKSKGNVVDPLEIMAKYGTDAVRFTLAVMAMPGSDLPFSVDRMVGYRAFANKIWNAARFLLMKLPEDMGSTTVERIRELQREGRFGETDRWILSRLNDTSAAINGALEQYACHEAADAIYHFFWHEFCDWYIEFAKPRLAEGDPRRQETMELLLFVLDRSLRLLHPFMPFLTEEIWQSLPHEGTSIMVAAFPEAVEGFSCPEAESRVSAVQNLITAVRTIRAENNLPPGKRLPLEFSAENAEAELFGLFGEEIRGLAMLEEVRRAEVLSDEPGALKGACPGIRFQILAPRVADVSAERDRLGREIRKLEDEMGKISAKLGNADFLAKAPADVVNKNRKKFAELEEKAGALRGALEKLA